MIQYVVLETGWGHFGCVADSGRLIATYLPGTHREVCDRISREWPEAVEVKNLLPKLCRQVRAYFDGRAAKFDVDVDLSSFSPFQQSVLAACAKIPYGQTATYADLARAAGRPGAARAVGSTMARNPLPLIIPCHRVLRSDGTLGGFSSPRGISEKKRMLLLEDGARFNGERFELISETSMEHEMASV